jgi:glucose-6-phosphate 1-epimerase
VCCSVLSRLFDSFVRLILNPSDKAVFEPGKAIRGGVPIVWPQFGPGPLLQHGFARIKSWQLGEKSITDDVSVQLHLTHDDDTLKVWPHKFHLIVTIRLTEQSLHQELQVTNIDDHSFDFTALFHTYFNVNDINTTNM